MVSISNVAQRILDENGLSTTQIAEDSTDALTAVEYLIDNAIDTVNLRAGTSISNLSGTAGSKSYSATSDQTVVVKELTALLLRAYKDKGPNVNVAMVSATAVLADPNYDYYMRAIREDINRLRGRTFTRT